jgi:xanthine/uracil/vitamin C permease (AzgA family)
MTIKQKLMNIIAAQPKLITLGVGLAVTFGIATIIGMVGGGQEALAAIGIHNPCPSWCACHCY